MTSLHNSRRHSVGTENIAPLVRLIHVKTRK